MSLAEASIAKAPREVIYRHRVATRLTHWINVLCLSVLLLSTLIQWVSRVATRWR